MDPFKTGPTGLFATALVSLGKSGRFSLGVVPTPTAIDDFRGACAFKRNGAVAGHVKRVDHDDVFDALLFR